MAEAFVAVPLPVVPFVAVVAPTEVADVRLAADVRVAEAVVLFVVFILIGILVNITLLRSK